MVESAAKIHVGALTVLHFVVRTSAVSPGIQVFTLLKTGDRGIRHGIGSVGNCLVEG